MNCAAINSDDVLVIAQYLAVISACFSFFGFCAFKLVLCLEEAVVNMVRKRGAAAPFAERAVLFERRAQRWAKTFERIAERNRREAARLESQ